MVADVRMVISMRLRRILDMIDHDIKGDMAMRARVALARTDFNTAQAMRAEYRSRIVREFPGCEITFTWRRVYIKLPPNYPQANVPVSEQLNVVQMEVLSPRGLSNQQF